MPSTVAQAALLILLGLPGLVWITIRELRRPQITRSSLRETLDVVVGSALIDAIGFSISLWIWANTSSLQPRLLLSDFNTYYAKEPPLTLAWVGTGLAISASVAAATSFLYIKALDKARQSRSRYPVWYRVFSEIRGRKVGTTSGVSVQLDRPAWCITCQLDDDTQVTGILDMVDDSETKDAKRDVSLLVPVISSKAADGRTAFTAHHNLMVINEQHIRWWAATILSEPAIQEYVSRFSRVQQHSRS